MADKKRLIDANALLQSEVKRCGSIPTIGLNTTTNTSFKRILDQAPTVDAVEVVRCRDCKHWGSRTENEKGFIVCPASGMKIHTEAFCSYGEKRADA